MPTISLRLTEAELEALRGWAHDSRRSIQKELIWRLFAATLAERRAAGLGETDARRASQPDALRSVSADAQPRDIPARMVEFPGERTRGGPDPKPGQKR